MDDKSAQQQRLAEAIEAYRPGIDDLSAPELAPLAERLQQEDSPTRQTVDHLAQYDARLTEAFQDISIPDGLAERLLARLEATNEEDPSEEVEPSLVEPARTARGSRGWWLAAAGAVSVVAASVVVMAVVGFRPEVPLSPAQLQQVAVSQFDLDSSDSALGESCDQVAPPGSHPYSRDLLGLRQIPDVRWQRLDDFAGRGAVVYRMDLGGSGRASLYVLREEVANLPPTPPRTPFNSAGKTVGIWGDEGIVYLLVLDGGPGVYRQMVRWPGPVT